MGQNKKKKKQNRPQAELPVNVSISKEISPEEMQHVIAKAIVEADEIKEQRNKEQQAKELAEWRKAIGKKDYSSNPIIMKYIKTFFNTIWCILKMPFISSKNIKGDRASFGLLQMCVAFFFGMAFLLTLISSFVLFFGGIALLFIPIGTPISTTLCIWYIIIGVACFLLAAMFRMASVEIQKIEDRNYLFGIFASVASIVSIIIALITISKGG